MTASVATLPIEGLSVGHFSDREGITGCTVVLAPQGVTASVDIRGGAPGTLETALLSPYASVCELHAVLLTGGSAPGLGAAEGVRAFLREGGHGYRTPYARIPLVSAAVIYDLGVGSACAYPRPGDAYRAAVSASATVEEGSVGAGTGATVGKILGPAGWMKGGVGLASLTLGRGAAGDRGLAGAAGVTVAALTVVNALGDVLDEKGAVLAGARRDGAFVGAKQVLFEMTGAPNFMPLDNTTLSVVMTDARLDKLQCGIVARMSHDGFARAVEPVHTPVDGDCVFVLATGARESNVFQVGAAAAEVVAESIRRAVKAATGLADVPAISDKGGIF
jgi:L-aminopeptidase/D-esterase-like protein